MFIDVFNGDADGLCALVQLRLAEPRDAVLVTGVKRDIELLERVTVCAADQVTVLDISLAKNRLALERILREGAQVFYVDHHQAGYIPEHPQLKALINTDAGICTSLLVNEFLNGEYRAWAVIAAFGDNLLASAKQEAEKLMLTAGEVRKLQELGVCINYNSYGESVDDLHWAPERLYRELVRYTSPFEFIADQPLIYQQLQAGYASDLAAAFKVHADYSSAHAAVYILPDQAWARRVNGVFGNELSNRYPDRAHAVLYPTALGGFQVSVRAPQSKQSGADELCSSFPTGGGRKGAAGINHLPAEQLSSFVSALIKKYG